MINWFLILFAFLMPIADTIETDPKDEFSDAIYSNYDQYNFILAKRTKDYDLMVTGGTTGRNTFYGIFIDNLTNHPMDAIISDNYLQYHVPFNDHIASYPKLKLNNNSEYTITVTDLVTDQNIISEKFTTNPSAGSLNTAFEVFSGLGQDTLGAAVSLPVSVETRQIVNILSIVSIILFLGIIAAVVIFRKNKMPRYHHDGAIPVENQSHNPDSGIIDARYEEVPQETQSKPTERDAIVDKQAYMNNLFRMYENKEITEEELNEELKKVWGKHD